MNSNKTRAEINEIENQQYGVNKCQRISCILIYKREKHTNK